MIYVTLHTAFLFPVVQAVPLFHFFYIFTTKNTNHSPFFVWINQKNFYASVFEGTLYT